jgi:galactokinase
MGGSVLTAALKQLRTKVSVARDGRSGSTQIEFRSFGGLVVDLANENEPIDPIVRHSISLLKAVLWKVREDTRLPSALRFVVDGNIPLSGGLASSASLCIASITALYRLCGCIRSPYQIAETAFQAESTHAGVPCGRMDQYAIALGQLQAIDCSSVPPTINILPLKGMFQIVIASSKQAMPFSEFGSELRRRWDNKDGTLIRYFQIADGNTRQFVQELMTHQTLTPDACAAINRCHDFISEGLGIRNSELEQYVKIARSQNALCAKATGIRPVGGSIFALTTCATRDDIVSSLVAAGARVDVTTIDDKEMSTP